MLVVWGVTSAVACKIAIDLYGENKCRVIFIDTKNEDEDTYRFLKDCEKWYNLEIETLSNENYSNIQEVWYKYLSLNVANGAVCSSELKRVVREKWQRDNDYDYQVFGFDLYFLYGCMDSRKKIVLIFYKRRGWKYLICIS